MFRTIYYEKDNMIDITKIPTDKLKMDLQDSLEDIRVCEEALSKGIRSYSAGPVKERLNANKCFVKVITDELNRRKQD